jgi:hypothetical protein
MSLTKDDKKGIISKYGENPNDSGSTDSDTNQKDKRPFGGAFCNP